MSSNYEDLRRARFLWSFFKRMKEQIPEEKIDPKKQYSLKIRGVDLIAILSISQKLYKKSEKVRRFIEG